MRMLLDLGSIKTGGAVQLATNFLAFFKDYPTEFDKIFVLLPDRGPLSPDQNPVRYDGHLVYPSRYSARKLFELGTLNGFVKDHGIDTFFTFFGAGLPKPPGVRSVVSVAYPIICYPDSRYWNYLPSSTKIRTKVIGSLRRQRIRNADIVIAETAVMAQRLERHAGVASSRLVVIPPSPSAFLEERAFQPGKAPAKHRFLVLSGLDRHKNLWRLPAIAAQLVAKGYQDFQFVISTHRNQFEAAYSSCCIGMQQVLDRHFDFIGPIPATQIQSAYEQASFLVNLSDLESFSNNYMEAWKTSLPLICSDTDFARHICGDSATYIDPHDPVKAADPIIRLTQDAQLQARQAAAGKHRLARLPSLENRFSQIINIIRSIPR